MAHTAHTWNYGDLVTSKELNLLETDLAAVPWFSGEPVTKSNLNFNTDRWITFGATNTTTPAGIKASGANLILISNANMTFTFSGQYVKYGSGGNLVITASSDTNASIFHGKANTAGRADSAAKADTADSVVWGNVSGRPTFSSIAPTFGGKATFATLGTTNYELTLPKYSAGNGITISGTTISAKVNSNGGLNVDSEGLALKNPAVMTGGAANAGKVWKVDANGTAGWGTDNNTTYTAASNGGLTLTNNTVFSINSSAAGNGLSFSNGVFSIKLKTNSGLDVTLDGLALAKPAVITGGSTTDAGKVWKIGPNGAPGWYADTNTVYTEGNGISISTGNAISVKLNGSTLIANASGLKINTNGNANTYLNGDGSWSTPPGVNYTKGAGISIDNGTLSVSIPSNGILTFDTSNRLTVSDANLKSAVQSSASEYLKQNGIIPIAGAGLTSTDDTSQPKRRTININYNTHMFGLPRYKIVDALPYLGDNAVAENFCAVNSNDAPADNSLSVAFDSAGAYSKAWIALSSKTRENSYGAVQVAFARGKSPNANTPFIAFRFLRWATDGDGSWTDWKVI